MAIFAADIVQCFETSQKHDFCWAQKFPFCQNTCYHPASLQK